jgi:hypothetical protein
MDTSNAASVSSRAVMSALRCKPSVSRMATSRARAASKACSISGQALAGSVEPSSNRKTPGQRATSASVGSAARFIRSAMPRNAATYWAAKGSSTFKIVASPPEVSVFTETFTRPREANALTFARAAFSSSFNSRGKLITTSSAFLFTELHSTSQVTPAPCASPRPNPVMLFIGADDGRLMEGSNRRGAILPCVPRSMQLRAWGFAIRLQPGGIGRLGHFARRQRERANGCICFSSGEFEAI